MVNSHGYSNERSLSLDCLAPWFRTTLFHACLPLLLLKWGHEFLPTRLYLSTNLHVVTFQKKALFTPVNFWVQRKAGAFSTEVLSGYVDIDTSTISYIQFCHRCHTVTCCRYRLTPLVMPFQIQVTEGIGYRYPVGWCVLSCLYFIITGWECLCYRLLSMPVTCSLKRHVLLHWYTVLFVDQQA